jgi:hypothetical protein
MSTDGQADGSPASYRWTIFADLTPNAPHPAPQQPAAAKPKPKPKPKPKSEQPPIIVG